MGSGDAATSVRCSVLHAAEGVDPAGTAPHWDAVLVVEVPGPWPRDISEAEPFRSLCDAPCATITGADNRIWRPQGVVPADPDQGVRVVALQRHGGTAGPFARREWILPPGATAPLVELCAALIGADGASVERFAAHEADSDPGTVDLLVCTHGSRDVCCGSVGTSLFNQVSAAPELGAGVRIWRSSHAGGHRFAPTALSFPEGVSWSHLDPAAVMRILGRRDAEELAGHVRGAVSVQGPQAQVADREGFRIHGWGWFASEREVTVVFREQSSRAAEVELHTSTGGPDRDGVRVSVELAGYIPQPPCGVAEPTEVRTEPVWKVTDCAVLRSSP